jgi:hypothetical protein
MRESAAHLVMRADDARVAELQAIGEQLVNNGPSAHWRRF